VTCIGQEIDSYRVFVRKLEGKSRIGRSRRRWENDIKICLKKLERGRGVEKYDMTRDTDNWSVSVKKVMDLPVPQNARNFLTRKEF
jgi:hypothetical protein